MANLVYIVLYNTRNIILVNICTILNNYCESVLQNVGIKRSLILYIPKPKVCYIYTLLNTSLSWQKILCNVLENVVIYCI